MGKLKSVLGKTLSAVAVIGVAAVGVAAVVTVGSVIGRKKKSGDSNSDLESSGSGGHALPVFESRIPDYDPAGPTD